METSSTVSIDEQVELCTSDERIDNKSSVIKNYEEENANNQDSTKEDGIQVEEEASHSEDVMQTFDEFKNSQGSSLNQSYEEVKQRLI